MHDLKDLLAVYQGHRTLDDSLWYTGEAGKDPAGGANDPDGRRAGLHVGGRSCYDSRSVTLVGQGVMQAIAWSVCKPTATLRLDARDRDVDKTEQNRYFC